MTWRAQQTHLSSIPPSLWNFVSLEFELQLLFTPPAFFFSCRPLHLLHALLSSLTAPAAIAHFGPSGLARTSAVVVVTASPTISHLHPLSSSKSQVFCSPPYPPSSPRSLLAKGFNLGSQMMKHTWRRKAGFDPREELLPHRPAGLLAAHDVRDPAK